MGITSILYLNEYDTSRLGLLVERASGLPNGLALTPRLVGIPGRAGTPVLTPTALTQSSARTVDLRGVVKTASAALLRANLDALKDLVYAGAVELRFAERVDRFLLAVCTSFVVEPIGPQFGSSAELRLGFTCPDPLAYDRHELVVGLHAAAPAAVPLGTGVTAPVVRLFGAVNNPVVTYRDIRGIAKRAMGFTVNLGANDYLEIDCDLGTVTKYAAGVATDGLALLTSGDFLRLDPLDAAYRDSVFPTIELAAGTGECTYRRAWQ